jgi:hypothetical protein
MHHCTNGWLCEQHPDRGWPHDDCAGPGMPCLICQPRDDRPRLPDGWRSIASTETESAGFTFRVPAWRGSPVVIAELWKLTKGARVVCCTVTTHPIGAEIRCDVDGDLWQSRAGRDGLLLLDLANEGKTRLQQRGWAE